MAFPEINNSSDSRPDNAQNVKQTTGAISSMADISQKQTETSQPETATVASEVNSSEEKFSLPDDESWIVLELYNPENLYAYWNILSEDTEKLRQKGGQQFALRFYDVTFIDMDVQKPHSVQEYECEESAQELYIHVPMKERDYLVEIGYVTEAGRWIKLVRSSHIHFPWDFPWPEEPPKPTDEAEDSTEDEAEETPETEETTSVEETKTITDVKPLQIKSDLDDIPTEEISVVEVASTTETIQTISPLDKISPIVKQTESVDESIAQIETFPTETPQLEEPLTSIDEKVSTSNQTTENQFSDQSDQEIQSNISASKFNLGQSETGEKLAAVDEGLYSLPGGYGETKIVLLPVDPNWIYVYWDIPNEEREKLRKQGGKQLGLQVYDVTEVDLDTQDPHSVEYHECDELAREWHIPVAMSDRDYLVEIGYLTDKKRWLMLARSSHVRVPPVYPSDREDYQQRTVTWDENLRGKFFFNLKSGNSPLSFLETAIQMFQNPFSNPMPG